MTRSVPEWKGKTHDSPVPPRIRLRIFDARGGMCHITGRKIRAGESWDLDHIVPLIAGGDHCESNLAPALIDPHRQKTKAEVAEKSMVARKRKAHLGIKKKRTMTRWRNFRGEIITAPKER